MGRGDTNRGTGGQQLDRRAFVRLSTCGAGVIWAAPRIRSVAPAPAGTPPPSPTPPPPPAPPEVEAEVAAPPPTEPAPAPTPRAVPEVKGVRDGLAVTGTEIGQMTLLGVGAVVSGMGLRHVARRLGAAELERGTSPA